MTQQENVGQHGISYNQCLHRGVTVAGTKVVLGREPLLRADLAFATDE